MTPARPKHLKLVQKIVQAFHVAEDLDGIAFFLKLNGK